jgi:hypothetical protein
MRKITTLLAVFAGAAAIAAGCDANGTSTSSGPAKLTVLLTDAPFSTANVKTVSIFMRTIACRQASVSLDEATDTVSLGWTTVATPDRPIDLVPLHDGVTLDLGTQTLPSGSWQSCRIVIDPAQSFVELNDGSKPDVKWPSAAQSGIKVLLNEPVTVEDSSVLVLDFDVGSSFVLRGNERHNNGLLFKPVVHGVVRDVAATFMGVVRGDSVNGSPISAATVQLLASGTALDDTVAVALRTAATDTAGTFAFHFVAPGSYAVRALPPSGSTYKAALLDGGVTLGASETKSGAVIVLPK